MPKPSPKAYKKAAATGRLGTFARVVKPGRIRTDLNYARGIRSRNRNVVGSGGSGGTGGNGVYDEDVDESLPYGQGPYGCENCTESGQGFLDGAGDVVLELGSKEGRKFSKELEEVIINTGFEFWYTENFVLRFGYIYDKEGDITNPTFGAGVKFEGYGFDFGYTAGEQGHPRSNSLFFSFNISI